jgi:DHA1 family tetracycline resistance protein-like MFS transporter
MPILYIIVFTSLIGVGIVIPLLPFFGENVGATPMQITLLMAVFSLGQFLASPLWGWLSDRMGRKPVLVITTAGSIGAYILLGFADSVASLMVARLLAGLMAGNVVVAFAVVSDTTMGTERSVAMGRLGAAVAVGFMIGPAIGGVLAGVDAAATDFRLIALVAGGMSLLSLVLAVTVFRETLPAELLQSDDARPLVPGGLLPALRRILVPAMLALVGLNLLYMGAASMFESTFALYSYRVLSYGPQNIGYLFAYMGLTTALLQSFAIRPLVTRLGDMQLVRAAVWIYMAGLLGLIYATQLPAILLMLTILTVGNALFIPASTSLVSRRADASEVGAVLGLFQAGGNLGRVLGPTVSGMAFMTLGAVSPFVLAICLLLATLLVTRYLAAPGIAPAQAHESSQSR